MAGLTHRLHEYPSLLHLDRKLVQIPQGFIEIDKIPAKRNLLQPAAQIVGPGMVGTADQPTATMPGMAAIITGQETHVAMPANIKKRTDFMVIAADDDDRLR
jgi:hypothetical protein